MSDRRFADDELLSALIDGALSPEDAARLEQRLDREPALRARLDALERANSVVRESYAGVVDEPLPKRVLDLLGPDRADNVVPLPKRGRSDGSFFSRTALAASIALAFGVALGILVAPDRPTPDAVALAAVVGAVAPGTPLADVLESVPSAESREVLAGVSATPVLTFATADGAYCREVDLASRAGTTQLLACRRDGAWRVAHATYTVAASTDGVFRPASGPSPAIDAAIEELIDGAPLEPAAERTLIERGWVR
jgi:hypothetical protein